MAFAKRAFAMRWKQVSDESEYFRPKQAQVLWDETMAEAIALYYQNHPHAQIAVLVGKAHIMNNYAIPNRVARRINNPAFTQVSLPLGEAE